MLHRARRSSLRLSLALVTLGAGAAFSPQAQAQTRVLVLADGSTRFSAVSYYNSAISEFAGVVGAANVQSRNDLDTVSLTGADLRRPGGGSYDVVVLVASFNGIGTSNWALLREAVRTRAARSFVLFSDHCSICHPDNVDGGNGNGMVPLLNAASGWSATIGTLRGGVLGAPLNTHSPLDFSFVGMNPMQTNDYHSMNGIPADNAIYLAPGASLPPTGTTRIADVTAALLPTSQSYGGLGACVFGVADVNPLAIPGNPGRVGPAFVDAITSINGSCASGPLVITAPETATVTTVRRPTITGLAQPGSTVTVTVGGQTLTTTAAIDGSWSVTPATLVEGLYTATATRAFGGITQTASTTFTVTVCGSGVVVGDERCDDENTSPDDGCSALCAIEPGYECHGTRSICTRSDAGPGADASDATGTSDAAGTSDGAGTTDATGASDATGVTDVASATDATGVSDATSATDVTGVSDATGAADVTSVSDATGDVTSASDAAALDATGLSDASAVDAAEDSVATDASSDTDGNDASAVDVNDAVAANDAADVAVTDDVVDAGAVRDASAVQDVARAGDAGDASAPSDVGAPSVGSDDGGCGCAVPGGARGNHALLTAFGALGLLARRRRKSLGAGRSRPAPAL